MPGQRPLPKIFVYGPLSLYTAWITVAFIFVTSITLGPIGWSALFPPQGWAVIMLVVAMILAVIVAIPRHDLVWMGVFVWSAIGISMRPQSPPLVRTVGSTVAAFALAASIVSFLWVRQKSESVMPSQ